MVCTQQNEESGVYEELVIDSLLTLIRYFLLLAFGTRYDHFAGGKSRGILSDEDAG